MATLHDSGGTSARKLSGRLGGRSWYLTRRKLEWRGASVTLTTFLSQVFTMLSKLAIAFIALASGVAVNAQGIVESGTLTQYSTVPSPFTCEGAAGAGPVIAVSPALLETFTCGHTVRVFFGTGASTTSSLATIGQLDTTLTGGNIKGPAALFTALGTSGPGPISVTWDP
ncbi:hypothetical protein SISNIDRAFT_461413 [Sistotremastrum niveocremeum HHB9708]|uniref:Uncharacterized protein n=1 Tax=Sistotremastrum niveocremeum HHB9708 TaxID=1314777 RepID=A0A164MNT4_9AGAM|nr:hypothetical protein SISNIDRAFT_461413 [Sistotremastrum niveocremeum HHB9708]